MSPRLADLMALLPIRAINQTTLAAMAGGVPSGVEVIAAVLCVDPFINGEVLYRSLAESGAAGVANLPTVVFANDQMKKALEVAGLYVEQEIMGLATAKRFGLVPTAVVLSYADALRATARGISTMILHPGLPTGDQQLDRRIAEGADATLDRLLRHGLDVTLYQHPEFSTLLDAAAARAPRRLTWALPSV